MSYLSKWGRSAGEEMEFDPILKKWGRFGWAELGKSVFQDKGFPAVSKKVKDTVPTEVIVSHSVDSVISYR